MKKSIFIMAMSFLIFSCEIFGPVEGVITVYNNSGNKDITGIYYAPTGGFSGDFGSNQLSRDITAGSSDSESFTAEVGYYYAKVKGSDGNSYTTSSFEVADGGEIKFYYYGTGVSTHDKDPLNGTLVVTNLSTSTDITKVYIRVKNESSWGSNLLGATIVRNGNNTDSFPLEAGPYDVKIETFDDTDTIEYTLSSVDVGNGTTDVYFTGASFTE